MSPVVLDTRDRLTVGRVPEVWRRPVLESGVVEIPVSGEIGIVAAGLDGFHKDLADRMIAANALVQGGILVTADSRILGWPGSLTRHNARV